VGSEEGSGVGRTEGFGEGDVVDELGFAVGGWYSVGCNVGRKSGASVGEAESGAACGGRSGSEFFTEYLAEFFS